MWSFLHPHRCSLWLISPLICVSIAIESPYNVILNLCVQLPCAMILFSWNNFLVRLNEILCKPTVTLYPSNIASRHHHSLSLVLGGTQWTTQPIFSLTNAWIYFPIAIGATSFGIVTTESLQTWLCRGKMFDLTFMGGNKHSHKWLKHLTKSHANQMISTTPLDHTPNVFSCAFGYHQREWPASMGATCFVLSTKNVPGGINQPWLYTKFNRTGRHSFGHDIPDMNPQVSYAQHKYGLQQDRKRCRIENGNIPTVIDCEPMHGSSGTTDHSSFGTDTKLPVS